MFIAALSIQRVRVNVDTPPQQEAQDAWLAGATCDVAPLTLYGSAAGNTVAFGVRHAF